MGVEIERKDLVAGPDWLGTVVSDDDRYSKSSLSAHPWGAWPPEQR